MHLAVASALQESVDLAFYRTASEAFSEITNAESITVYNLFKPSFAVSALSKQSFAVISAKSNAV